MKLVSKAEAKSQGLKRFFTGEPCGAGHISERQVTSGVCVACGKARASAARAADPEKFRQRKREKYQQNPEKFRIEQRAIRTSDPDRARFLARNRRSANPEKYRTQQRELRRFKRDLILTQQRERRSSQPDRFRGYDRAWHAANPEKVRAKTSKRRAAQRRAVPTWFGEFDEFVWLEAADVSRRRSLVTGFKWNADHMVPLRSKSVSGLHTWNNCQVIPATLNSSKKNRMVLTNPLEWVVLC